MGPLIPERLRANWRFWFGAEQAVEVASGVEERLVAAIEGWALEEVEPLGDGQVAAVCSCRHRGQHAVLKVSPRRRHQTQGRLETEALRLWTGLAPRVLAARDDGWTVLLERIDPGVPLAFCRTRLEGLQVLGEVARELHRYPAEARFPSLATEGLGRYWRTSLESRPDATAELDELLATAGDPVLLHLDLHLENVLREGDGWRVIDPKPHRGDPHAECFVFLSLAGELPDRGAANTVSEWIALYCAAAALDEERLRRWIRIWAQAEMGNSSWGANMARLVEALGADRDHETYVPMMSAERVRKLRQWQDRLFNSSGRDEDVSLDYLGMKLEVPHQVHPPAPQPELLGRAVLSEVRETDRVLDMGTGSGVNALLAASRSQNVLAVDNNPFAVECARANVERNGLSSRVRVIEGSLFEAIDGRFDLIIFDPPFRWFAPRDVREAATTDENYQTLTAFFAQVGRYLADEARVLIGFGSSGDLDYLHHLIRRARLEMETLSTWSLVKDGLEVEYHAYRLARSA